MPEGRRRSRRRAPYTQASNADHLEPTVTSQRNAEEATERSGRIAVLEAMQNSPLYAPYMYPSLAEWAYESEEEEGEEERNYNGILATTLFDRIDPARLEEYNGDALNETFPVEIPHMDDDFLCDLRLRSVSLGFAISIPNRANLNARATFSKKSAVSVVDYRFVRLIGLLTKMHPLRPCDKIQLRKIGARGFYTPYGAVVIPFRAGKWTFNMRCWVIDIPVPVEIVLGQDWKSQFSVEMSYSPKDGLFIKTCRARENAGPKKDVYQQLRPSRRRR
ncbi:hypothetical protein DENSPDRAFT_838104 [Dentipellis sp. KUC8613]|nr:hypothetical protein DENSPDRAFT_838104 [Dentipellis sp. KUC8613]